MKKFGVINIIIAAYLLIKFCIIAYLSNFTSLLNYYDMKILIFFHNIAVLHSLALPVFITDLGGIKVVGILLILLSIILVYYKNFRYAALLLLTTSTGFLTSQLLKEIFKKPRPPFECHLVQAQGYSFPSGHTLLSTCFYGTLIFIIFKLVKASWLKLSLSALLTLLIILVGLSRVYLGVHFPTDIVGSWLLSAFILFFWINLYNMLANRKSGLRV